MHTNDPATDTHLAPSDTVVAPDVTNPSLWPPHGSHAWRVLPWLLLVLTLLGSGYVGWKQWRQEQYLVHRTGDLAQKIRALEQLLTLLSHDEQAWKQQLSVIQQSHETLRDQWRAQQNRLRTLNHSLNRLTEKNFSHDKLLLDNIEVLLRAGKQRYTLFRDNYGAAKAYALAGQSLAREGNPSFANLQRIIEDERKALLKHAPMDRQTVLANLAQWRDKVPTLPLSESTQPDTSPPPTNAWQRIKQALSSVIRIHHNDGNQSITIRPRLAYELLDLDLARVQAAVLAGDTANAYAALKHARVSLDDRFNHRAAIVQHMRDDLTRLLVKIKPVPDVSIGAALNELHHLYSMPVSHRTTKNPYAFTIDELPDLPAHGKKDRDANKSSGRASLPSPSSPATPLSSHKTHNHGTGS